LYDAANERVLNQTLDEVDSGTIGAEQFPTAATERNALFVLPGDFERRGLVRTSVGGDAVYAAGTVADPDLWQAETQYLVGGARVVWKDSSPVTGLDGDHRITFALGDMLGSTAAVVDLLSGEFVESSTYYSNGSRESYRAPDTENVAAEPNGFTGKEEDAEVGLVYFGERYLIPRLGRWASPDPLSVHEDGGGESLNAYHYVGGNLLQVRDPIGLAGESPIPVGNAPGCDTGGIGSCLPGSTSPGGKYIYDPALRQQQIGEAEQISGDMAAIAKEHAGRLGGSGVFSPEGVMGGASPTGSPTVEPTVLEKFVPHAEAGGKDDGVVGGMCPDCDMPESVDPDTAYAASVGIHAYDQITTYLAGGKVAKKLLTEGWKTAYGIAARKKLRESLGEALFPNAQAHHIVAITEKHTKKAREKLLELDIDINAKENGFWLPSSKTPLVTPRFVQAVRDAGLTGAEFSMGYNAGSLE